MFQAIEGAERHLQLQQTEDQFMDNVQLTWTMADNFDITAWARLPELDVEHPETSFGVRPYDELRIQPVNIPGSAITCYVIDQENRHGVPGFGIVFEPRIINFIVKNNFVNRHQIRWRIWKYCDMDTFKYECKLDDAVARDFAPRLNQPHTDIIDILFNAKQYTDSLRPIEEIDATLLTLPDEDYEVDECKKQIADYWLRTDSPLVVIQGPPGSGLYQ